MVFGGVVTTCSPACWSTLWQIYSKRVGPLVRYCGAIVHLLCACTDNIYRYISLANCFSMIHYLLVQMALNLVLNICYSCHITAIYWNSFDGTLWGCHNRHDGVSNHQPPIVYSTIYSDADRRKHQSSASLAFVRGNHWGPVNFPHKWSVTRKMLPFDDVIMKYQNFSRISDE